jgi:outer membrane protein assembly factor BamB
MVTMIFWATLAQAADNWTQFRGPGSQGRSDSVGMAVNPADPANVRWKTPIHGRAWSSPVVWGKQVWLTSATEDGTQLFAICVDRETGKIIYDLKLFDVATPQYAHPFNTYASPTPVIEEGRVYVTFGSPGTACLDTATGKVLWSRTDFVCNHFRGAGSSPIPFENLLLMHFDGSDFQFVVALDKSTGKTVWKTNRSIDYQDLNADGKPKVDGDLRKGFSTPVIADVAGRPVMISLASKACYAYDPRTGLELWRVEERDCHSGSSTPVLGDGLVYACMGHARGQLFAMRPDGKGVVSTTHVAWKVQQNIPTRNSPVRVGELLYVVDDNGVATCLDARTGQEIWRQRLKGQYSASPLFADGRIYFFSETGHITVIEPGRQYKQLAEGKMDDGFMASAAVAGNAFYLRSKTSLYRVETKR